MTTNTSAVRTKAPLSPLRIVASALFLLFGILSIVIAVQMNEHLLYWFNYWSQTSEAEPEAFRWFSQSMYFLARNIATPVLAILIAVLGLILRKRWLQPALGAFLFLFVFVASWVTDLVLYGNIATWTQRWDFENSYFDSVLGWISLAICVLALVFSLVASLLSPKVTQQIVQPEAAVLPQSTQTSPKTATQTSGQSNLTNLPMFALIGAFIIPLAGIILGHLSLSYMKKGQLSTQNKGMATAGLILGYVFVGLGFLTGLILFIVLIVSAATGF
jgi:peptidyl-prolyl cis-trans isomerase B (cyclophilin B)